jgi:hypothetical protein
VEWGGGEMKSMTNNASVRGREACLGFYVGECPMFQKYW